MQGMGQGACVALLVLQGLQSLVSWPVGVAGAVLQVQGPACRGCRSRPRCTFLMLLCLAAVLGVGPAAAGFRRLLRVLWARSPHTRSQSRSSSSRDQVVAQLQGQLRVDGKEAAVRRLHCPHPLLSSLHTCACHSSCSCSRNRSRSSSQQKAMQSLLRASVHSSQAGEDLQAAMVQLTTMSWVHHQGARSQASSSSSMVQPAATSEAVVVLRVAPEGALAAVGSALLVLLQTGTSWSAR